MIITRNWLNEWLDIENYSLDELSKTFNRIGLEVDRAFEFQAPKGVVVGNVKSVENHPDADKLQICQIDIGESEPVQIVTNDKKVGVDDFVPVATVGTKLPTFKIKKGKLRGIESFGMLCSTEEFGIPRVGEGVVILDNSIGELKVGKELSEFPIFNDSIIELELTANRGDCLSIYGIARDISSALNIKLRNKVSNIDEVQGEFLDFEYSLKYLHFNKVENANLKIKTRLAIIEKLKKDNLENILKYASHSTGTIFKAVKNAGEDLKLVDNILVSGNSKIGIFAENGSEIIEISYINPDVISKNVYTNKLKTDELYYNSSRGSEPNLNLAFDFLSNLNLIKGISEKSSFQNIQPKRTVEISFSEINNFIGAEIEQEKVLDILGKLGFELNLSSANIKILIPKYRHDIINKQDIIEEILRMVGIDNIPSKPLIFSEKRKDNKTAENIQLKINLRNRAISQGFFETLLYLFGEEKKFQEFGFETSSGDKKLLNPIIDTMDSLRPTMVIGLLEAVEKNLNFGKKRVPLFEIGKVFDKNLDETEFLTILFSGEIESDSIQNSGKPKDIDFLEFSNKVLSIIGGGTLKQIETNSVLMHPYQTAKIVKDDVEIGIIYKLRIDIQAQFNLPTTFIAEIELDKLENRLDTANSYSKFQTSSRDLSLVIPAKFEYQKIEALINSIENSFVQRFYPVDIFQLENGNQSLTIRFSLQSMEKTLEDSDIEVYINSVLEKLSSELNINLR